MSVEILLTRTCLTAVCWVMHRSPHTNFSAFCQREPTADIRDTQIQEWRTDSFSWTAEKQHSFNHFFQSCSPDFAQMMTLRGDHLCHDLRFSEIWARIWAFQTEITSRWSRRVKGKSPGEGGENLKVRRFASFSAKDTVYCWDWFSAEDVIESHVDSRRCRRFSRRCLGISLSEILSSRTGIEVDLM